MTTTTALSLLLLSRQCRRTSTALCVQRRHHRLYQLQQRWTTRRWHSSVATASVTTADLDALAWDTFQPERTPLPLPLPPLTSPSRVFQVTAPYVPTGDQPAAIQEICQRMQEGDRFSILRGITGTGKTLVMSHIIAATGKPTLVLCHNKTLAAQLCRELRNFLKKNAVELFVSYYNHYVPESFVETTGKYIAKKTSVNDEIDALRHRATRALLERPDVVVVASVSCIYGLGLPKDYLEASVFWEAGTTIFQTLHEVEHQVQNSMLYQKPESEMDLNRCNYQLANIGPRDFVLTIWPPNEKYPLNIFLQQQSDESSGFIITSIQMGSPQGLSPSIPSIRIFPARHHVIAEDRLDDACLAIETEMRDRVAALRRQQKLVEAARLQQRVTNDLLLLRETGYCSGVENYSRHIAGRNEGDPPDTLMDFLAMNNRDWLLLVDESHVTLPQLKAMYGGDRARKQSLVKHGFRLPSAVDNRPLREDEFWKQINQAVFVSATPSRLEAELAPRPPVDMVIRPTFVCDPIIHVRPIPGQLENLLEEIVVRAQRDERTLALALTKRDAEDLANFLVERGVRAAYIHCSLTTHERADAIKSLQSGQVDCLVGVNLLREGLDLPQVSLVAILNADSEGFLRSETALLQTVGRAARNSKGTAIFYANRVTDSMKKCIDATESRREKQLAYNEEHGCTTISTKGSTMLTIFDLLKDELQEEIIETAEFKNRARGHDGKTITEDLLAAAVTTPFSTSTMGISPDVSTDHLPSKPGVYFWRDAQGKILYVGKANKLRNRVKSYLTPNAKHSPRIKTMLLKATNVDIILTPSNRDALILESNLIKHHQPPYNVLLKDDEAYPYICASVGDKFPRLFISPRRQEGDKASKYRYFGPYPHFKEINAVLEGIEAKYDLRAKSFAARHGDGDKLEYTALFNQAISEVFEREGDPGDSESLHRMRSQFEEASVLFESKWNTCRDVVAIGQSANDDKKAIVHVVQLRDGMVAGRFSYSCEVLSGIDGVEDYAALIQTVLERQHYPSGESSRDGRTSFFPDEILVQYPFDPTEVKKSVRTLRKELEPERIGSVVVRTATGRGQRKETDLRALEFAIDNAAQVASQRAMEGVRGATFTSLDGTATTELASLLSLDTAPNRIECYDISHTQGDFAVGSRVVFVNGRPAPALYRRFNIKTVEGVDDYASLTEVLERRFLRSWVNGAGGGVTKDSPWALPDLVVIDGGRGQLSAAIKGMARASVFPKSSSVLSDEAVEDVGSTDAIIEQTALVHQGKGRRASVPICALAKENEELFVHDRQDPVNESGDSPALLLLRSLRDESHRFALTAHRKRRSVTN